MNLWLRIFLPFAAGFFVSYLFRNVNAVIAPDLTRELGLSSADLGVLTAAYLFAFGMFQLPLGILLDRYGPRRVETGLLVIAAAGSTFFALGGSLPELALARAAIGLGVSACLMASFKAFSAWFPVERQPSINAAVMTAGSLGALTVTTPLSATIPGLGWRGVFFILAGIALAAAAGIFSVPEKALPRSGGTLGQQLKELGGIVRSRVFWRYAPQAAMIIGGFMALQGLWAVPWLMQVGGRSREAAAFHLLLTTIAMLCGFLCIALFIGPLRRCGIQPDSVLTAGMAAGLVTMLGVLLGAGQSHVLWFVLGLVFTISNLSYALLSAHFPPSLAGRVNTALNVGTIFGAFAIQWGYGEMIDLLAACGWSIADAHRAAFGMLLALQTASFICYLLRKPDPAAGC